MTEKNYIIKILCLASFVFLTSCQSSYYSHKDKSSVKPIKSLSELEELPSPNRKITVAIYDFPDLTGAFKSNDAFAVYSKAVSQAGDTIVIDALLRAGHGTWFNVLERKGLNALVQERKISEVNQNLRNQSQAKSQELLQSLGKSLEKKNVNFLVNNSSNKNVGNIATQSNDGLKINPQTNFGFNQQRIQQQQFLAPANVGLNNQLLGNAEYIIQGGIVGYDSDEVTSGAGLRLLNIGGFGEVRKDIVTVNMRLVDVRNGNIVLNKTLAKGIYSQKLQGSSFGFVDVDKILETEIGYSYNEPVFEVLNLTIQAAVLDIIKQGISRNLWQFRDVVIRQNNLIQNHLNKQNIVPVLGMKPVTKMSPVFNKYMPNQKREF